MKTIQDVLSSEPVASLHVAAGGSGKKYLRELNRQRKRLDPHKRRYLSTLLADFDAAELDDTEVGDRFQIGAVHSIDSGGYRDPAIVGGLVPRIASRQVASSVLNRHFGARGERMDG